MVVLLTIARLSRLSYLMRPLLTGNLQTADLTRLGEAAARLLNAGTDFDDEP